MSDEFEAVARLEDVPENGTHCVAVGAGSVLLCRVNQELFAVENRCPHQNSPLDGGRIRRGMILCPLHGMGFDLRSGHPKGNLTQVALRTFPVRVADGAVEIAVPQSFKVGGQ